MTGPILKLTDGTTSISLVTSGGQKGFHLDDWLPEIANYKGGGIRRNNSRADGESLSGKQWANVTEEFRTIVDGEDQDAVITTLQNLRRLFEKASDYWTAPWQNEPVWIEARGSCEANTRYSIVIRGHMPQDGNPHSQPFFNEPSIIGETGSGFLISVERQPWWLEQIPGTGICTQASGEQEDWNYDGWAVNTVQPINLVQDIIEASCGNMLASDTGLQVWRTANGTVWNAATTPPAGQVGKLVEVASGNILCNTSNGIYRSQDCGDNWVQRNAAVTDIGHQALTLGNDGYLYTVDRTANQVLRSNDEGTVWSTVFTINSPQCVLRASNDRLYLGAFLLYYSIDGTNWITSADLLGTTDNWFTLASPGDGFVYAGSASGVLARTADTEENWGIIATFSDAVNEIILASDGFYYLSLNTGEIFKSPNATDWKLLVDIGTIARALHEYSGSNRIYAGETGNIWISPSASITVGRSQTCNDEAYIANEHNIAQLTHVKVDDGGVFTDNFPATLPFDLLPDPFVANDAVYFGIETSLLDSGPFCNLVFDIGDTLIVTGVNTFVWEYWNGAAWATLSVVDGTAGLWPFENQGVNSVHWVPPNNWSTTAVDGVTGYWIRLRVSAVAVHVQTPTQQNQDIYTINWPRVDIDDAQVLGDIPALLRIQAHNRSDEDYYETIDELDLLENRMVVGLRSLDRGSSFVSFINLADEQNPIGISVSAGTGSAFANKLNAPTGRMITHTTPPTGSLSTYADAATITFGPSISRDFYGTYHTYLRAQLVEPAASPVGDDTDVQVRLSVRSGSGGITKTTKHVRFVGWDENGETFKDWQLLNLGKIDLPVSDLFNDDELPDEFQIVIQVSSATSTNLEVNLYDLVLIPVDEWAGDFIDTALEDDSGVGNGYKLDIDSVTFPKRRIRALVRSADSSELIRASYQPITPGPAILQSNADQRLWFLTARAAYQGEHTGLDNASVLTDDHADFLRAGVKVGQTIFNITDGSSGTITARTQTTITATLSGGAGNDWDIGDDYLVICNGVYTSEPWNCHSIQLERNSRYLSFRGER
jgi:hypothetical protein